MDQEVFGKSAQAGFPVFFAPLAQNGLCGRAIDPRHRPQGGLAHERVGIVAGRLDQRRKPRLPGGRPNALQRLGGADPERP